MSITICHKSNIHAVEYFKNCYNDFKPIKKLVSFQNNENFLLTPYSVADASIHMVIENQAGDQIQFSGLNCGYHGSEPTCTTQVLCLTGISRDIAETWTYNHKGLQIEFSDNPDIGPKIYSKYFFVDSIEENKFSLFNMDEYSQVNILQNRVYMINPQKNNLRGLFNTFALMEPYELEYYIGKDSPLLNSLRVSDLLDIRRGLNYGHELFAVDGVNLIISGKKFDVVCLINHHEIVSTVNCVYNFLMKRPLFEIKRMGGYVLLPKGELSRYKRMKYYIKLLLSNKEQYARLPIYGEEYK